MLNTIGILYPKSLLETIAVDTFARFIQENGCDVHCFGSVDDFHKSSIIVDIVVSFDVNVPNVFEVPTFLALDSHPSSFVQQRVLIRNILTYDGYLTDSAEVKQVLEDLIFSAKKVGSSIHKFSKFYEVLINKENIDNPKIEILNSLFWLSDSSYPSKNIKRLSKAGRVTFVYPSFQIKRLLKQPFIPLKTTDFLSSGRATFAGQLYWVPDSKDSNSPAITLEIKWALSLGMALIVTWKSELFNVFGDSLIYLQPGIKPKELDRELKKIQNWARDNVTEVKRLAASSQKIYRKEFVPNSRSFDELKKFFICTAGNKHYPAFRAKTPPPRSPVSYSFIIRTGGKALQLERALDSIVAQEASDITIILVLYKPLENIKERLLRYSEKLDFKIVEDFGNLRSTGIVLGMANVSSDYFGLLDDDDTVHPNHIGTLMASLEMAQKIEPNVDQRLVFCGNYLISKHSKFEERSEWGTTYGLSDPSHRVIENFRFYEPKLMSQHMWYMASNSWLAHKSLINATLLRDPKTHSHEDIYFELQFAMQTRFVFSAEVTAAHWFDGQNSTILDVSRNAKDVFHHIFSLTYRNIGNYTYRHISHTDQFSVSGAYFPTAANTGLAVYRRRLTATHIFSFFRIYRRFITVLSSTHPKRLLFMIARWFYRKLVT